MYHAFIMYHASCHVISFQDGLSGYGEKQLRIMVTNHMHQTFYYPPSPITILYSTQSITTY